MGGSSLDLIGVTLADRYVPTAILGSGGNADVLLADDLRTGGGTHGTHVAIKVLHSRHRGLREAEERMKREGRIAGSLRHPNVCGVTDVARLPNETESTFLVMELLRGESLDQRLARRRDGRLEIDEAIDIVYQILSGLSAAHAIRIVHRDLKPANVFLVPLGPRSTVVKVLDFGGAFEMDGAATQEFGQLTRTGRVVGTPVFMTPEQVLGARDFDARTDLYVCGALLYRMVTGALPYDAAAGDLLRLMEAIAHERPLSPRTYRPDLPVELENVIETAMAHHKDARFQTTHEFQEALLAVVTADSSNLLLPHGIGGASSGDDPMAKTTGSKLIPIHEDDESERIPISLATAELPIPIGLLDDEHVEEPTAAADKQQKQPSRWDLPTQRPDDPPPRRK